MVHFGKFKGNKDKAPYKDICAPIPYFSNRCKKFRKFPSALNLMLEGATELKTIFKVIPFNIWRFTLGSFELVVTAGWSP